MDSGRCESPARFSACSPLVGSSLPRSLKISLLQCVSMIARHLIYHGRVRIFWPPHKPSTAMLVARNVRSICFGAELRSGRLRHPRINDAT